MRRPVSLSLTLLATAALGLSACKRVEAPAEAAAPQAPAAAAKADGALDATANDNLNAVLWMQRAQEYRAITEQTYRAAADHLDVALKEAHWDALVPEERGNEAKGLKPAVVLDVDETVLDNSPYQARLVRDGKEYDELSWDQWVAEKKAKAIPGVVDFAKAANAKGVTLLYISNRAVHLKDATLANLREQGLPVADDSVFFGLGTVVEGCLRGSDRQYQRWPRRAAAAVPRLVRRALVDAAQPDLRRLRAGAVQQRLRAVAAGPS